MPNWLKKLLNTLRNLLIEYKSPRKLAFAVALGIFTGTSPLWGLHLLLAIGLAFLFRLNKSAVVFSTLISNPWFAPLLIFCSLQTGSLILHGHSAPLALYHIKTILKNPDWQHLLEKYLQPYFWGAFFVGFVLAFCSYWLPLWICRYVCTLNEYKSS